MTYDPAWDMPFRNYQQRGSFVEPLVPLTPGPGDTPLVCLPPINQYWLPLVLGCLDQLANPSTWLAGTDDALNSVLEQAQLLKQMFGVREVCPVPFELRVDGCELQYSTDGGDTFTTVTGWSDFLASCIPPQTLLEFDSGCTLSESLDGGDTYTAVPGWIDNFANCVQEYTPIIGLPPNPGDKTPDELACAISKYISEQVIVAAMGKAVTAISDDLTLLQFGLDVVNIIPEFVLVSLAADAFSAIYVAVQEGTLSDFEAALTDATLLSDVICAFYGCIVADGYVKPANFACIVAAVGSISYAHSDVISAIVAYLNALGATGLAQLSQVAGLETGEDCSACGNWCYVWGPAFVPLDENWATVLGRGLFSSGVWNSVFQVDGEYLYIVIELDPTRTYTEVLADVTFTEFPGAFMRFWTDMTLTTLVATEDTTTWAGSITGAGALLLSHSNTSAGFYIGQITMEGTGANPFGVDNC